MTLKDEGYRFTYRPGLSWADGFKWRHPTDTQPGDVDCTDMGDEEYTWFVESVS